MAEAISMAICLGENEYNYISFSRKKYLGVVHI